MHAAVYARVSKEKIGVTEEAKSPARQIENARAFAVARGWTIAEAHVYVDDGISGAEFKRRPGFQRMLAAALTPRPPFQILIVSEQKSIGREASETGYVIKQLAQAGVEIFEYMHGRSLTPRNALDKVLSTVQGFGDELHREQTSERVHESHTRSVKAGHVVGGRCFGFRNQDVYLGEDAHGRPLKSHVERVIHPGEAAVVVRIFQMYDAGLGLKRIAKQLNIDKAASPTPFMRKDGLAPIIGWSPATVRTILARELYNGIIVWSRTRKRPIAWGQVDQQARPASEWQRVPAEHLRIVPEDLWRRVASRRADTEGRATRFASGRLSGRTPKTTHNLLAGLATCGVCGGGLVVETSPRKRGRVPEYVCSRHRTNGTCANTLHPTVAEMNEAVLREVESHVLVPEAIDFVIHLSERDDLADRQTALARERKDVEKRIARLVSVLETGGDVAALVTKLRELEARRTAIDHEVSSLQPVPRLAPEVVENRLAEWRRLLRQSTTQGRTVLQRVLRGRLTFTPHVNEVSGEIDGYTFEAPTRFDHLFCGIVAERPKSLDPNDRFGLDGITPEDTGEADYGRLLDRVYVEGSTSPTGFEPVFWP
jgi:site-specific DNA recombinase